MRVLNLYAGLGGNRKLWTDCEVTAVELDPKIAEVYKNLNPNDTIIIGDAHEYLLNNFDKFDFIWSSPPCQTHSKLHKANCRTKKKYIEIELYQEIIFLQHFSKCLFLIENVVPYYEPLVKPTKKIGRHLFWTNFDFEAEEVKNFPKFATDQNMTAKIKLMEWLGINYEGNIYYKDNHCVTQVLRNCVHPRVGEQIFEQVKQLLGKKVVPTTPDPIPEGLF